MGDAHPTRALSRRSPKRGEPERSASTAQGQDDQARRTWRSPVRDEATKSGAMDDLGSFGYRTGVWIV